MERFSDRLGITKPPVQQVDSMNDALRHSLWNLLLVMFDTRDPLNERWTGVARSLAISFFKVPADEVPRQWYDCRDWVKKRYYGLEWFEVYNFIQHLSPHVYRLSSGRLDEGQYIASINTVLARENAGYRFVASHLVPITNSAETQAIEEARAKASASGLDAVRVHIDAALHALAQKPNPDHRNAVKEAISAVESAAKLVGKTDGQGLDGPLGELAEKIGMHPAFKKGVSTLYGWTSDAGIRHALVDPSKIDAADARFMVIACSAFVHFLIEKAERAGLLKVGP